MRDYASLTEPCTRPSGRNQCAIKIAAFGLSHPIVRRLTPTSKRSTIPAAADGIGRVYPIDWPQLSRYVRFERAGGVCQSCGRPHGEIVRVLPDGRWYDAARQTWRNGRGRPARWPTIEEAIRMRQTRVVLAVAHLDHNPSNNQLRNLRGFCQRCHLIHDRPHHLARRRITYLLRRALGDLFLGRYSS